MARELFMVCLYESSENLPNSIIMLQIQQGFSTSFVSSCSHLLPFCHTRYYCLKGPTLRSDLRTIKNRKLKILAWRISPVVDCSHVWPHGWPRGGPQQGHASPHLLDHIREGMRNNQILGTTATLVVVYYEEVRGTRKCLSMLSESEFWVNLAPWPMESKKSHLKC